MQTLLDNAKTDRPERRTALVAKELACYKNVIAVLSETHLLDEGQLIECGCGYTLFWSGCSDEEWRESGVGFVIKSQILWKLANLPKGISHWLMTLQLPLGHNKCTTAISAYTPTMTNPEEMKNRFYNELDTVIKAVSKSDKLLPLGAFNARVRSSSLEWSHWLPRH